MSNAFTDLTTPALALMLGGCVLSFAVADSGSLLAYASAGTGLLILVVLLLRLARVLS